MSPSRFGGQAARQIYRRLFSSFGKQHWWPGETPFEVAVGAILTQNTAWPNAAGAVQRLKEKRLLSAARLVRVSQRQLARWIRSSGYFNQKAKRLKVFARFLADRYGGDMLRFRQVPVARAREELLQLHGIGPETADSILLYALNKPVFVVDTYTRRILARHSLVAWDASYPEIQAFFTGQMPAESPLFNEYHALLVALGKKFCLTHPRCDRCPLREVGHLRLERLPG